VCQVIGDSKYLISLATAPAGFREFRYRGDERDGRTVHALPLCSFSVSANSARVCRGLPELPKFHAKFAIPRKSWISDAFFHLRSGKLPDFPTDHCKLPAFAVASKFPSIN
jgi:hypothetical protein